jgi:hypothetical protein
MRRTVLALLLSALWAGLLVSSAAAAAVHTRFEGLYFPAGMPGTGTTCPYTWVDPSFCVIAPGTSTAVDGGGQQIRGMVLYELAFSWRVDNPSQVEPRKTGYDIVTASASLDATLTGPTWGTWKLYSFDSVLMFSGTFRGSFLDGIPAVRFVGLGTGQYKGQHMSGTIGRVPDPYNMFGQIIETGA